MVDLMQSVDNEALLVPNTMHKRSIHYNLSPEELTAQTIVCRQGELTDKEALLVNTGAFTGRSPKDKFIVKDELTRNTVYWNEFNIPMEERYFSILYNKIMDYLSDRTVWVRDCIACADDRYSLPLRIINETPWANLFCYNMFLRPEKSSQAVAPDWKIIHAPGFQADPQTDGTRKQNFSVINFSKKTVLIGGSAYTGEIKKGVFTILNYLLPLEKEILSMHCSANIGKRGDTSIFFGLSGTGKTTLSTDATRKLIGDDEHGWTDEGVFNFEGGCYAKCIDLCQEKEPEIYAAIRKGALLENAVCYPATNEVDYRDKSITENTRVSYPIDHIENIAVPSVGNHPNNIFFLTCDAYGVLPPVSRLNSLQAMFHFMSGYTARVAGTEEGVKEPKSTFSACFGAPFLPLHPSYYAAMLRRKIEQHDVHVWLINTGWYGGAYGVGKRISLAHTRAIIHAILNGELSRAEYKVLPVFALKIPVACKNVPAEILDPQNNWSGKIQWLHAAEELARQFVCNFSKFNDCTDQTILDNSIILQNVQGSF
jgi:phosphoenolpyruvate carboxykinase (ATP)